MGTDSPSLARQRGPSGKFGCRDRDRARTLGFGGTSNVFTLALSPTPMVTFLEAPCDPRRSDSPSPVLTLAVFPRPSQHEGSSNAGTYTPLFALVYLRT